MKRVLLTGATGFIGKQCLPLLLEKADVIHAVTSRRCLETKSPDVNWHKVDLLDSYQRKKLMVDVKPTHLLHLAWYVEPGKWWNSKENFRWVQASLEMLEAFSSQGGQRAVIAGTCYEYDLRYSYCSELITPFLPTSTYGTCKHALQIMVESICKERELSHAWGRVFFLYGPNEHPKRLVSSVIRSLLQNEQARCSHGNQIRDYLYVRDVADAFVLLLESKLQGPLNIASECPISLKEIIYKIARKLNREDLVLLGALPASPDEPRLVVGNNGRLSKELGWKPKYDLDQGLDETINWWRHRLIDKS